MENRRREVDKLLADWEERCTLALLAHARSANRCNTAEVWLGGAAVTMTAAVGTGIFATLKSTISTPVRVIAGAIAVLAATLTAVHTFAKLPERAAAYEQASRAHASNRRLVELLRARLAAGETFDVWGALEEVRIQWERASAESPNASGRIWNRTRRELKDDMYWWERSRRWLSGRGWRSKLGQPDDRGGPRPPLSSGE